MFNKYTHQDSQKITTQKKAKILILVKAEDLSEEISGAFQVSGHKTLQVWNEYQVEHSLEKEKFDLVFIKDRPKLLYLKIPKIFYSSHPVLLIREVKNCVILNSLDMVMNPNFLDYSVQYLLFENSESVASSLMDR